MFTESEKDVIILVVVEDGLRGGETCDPFDM